MFRREAFTEFQSFNFFKSRGEILNIAYYFHSTSKTTIIPTEATENVRFGHHHINNMQMENLQYADNGG